MLLSRPFKGGKFTLFSVNLLNFHYEQIFVLHTPIKSFPGNVWQCQNKPLYILIDNKVLILLHQHFLLKQSY